MPCRVTSVYRSSFYTTNWWPMYGYNPLRQGRLVAHVIKKELGAGPHEITWNPRREIGPLSAGVYYLRLAVSGPNASREQTRKVVVMR